MSPSSGARSGTKPSRTGRGAGNGRVAVLVPLKCGHAIPANVTPMASTHNGRRMYVCPEGCSLQWEKTTSR